jgi:cysteine-rich repeat protein
MKHTQKPSCRTSLLALLFGITAVFGFVVLSAEQSGPSDSQPAFLLPRSSTSSLSSRVSVFGTRHSSSAKSVIRPLRRRANSGVLLNTRSSSSNAPIKASCGDGLISGTEQCDDKNTTSNDGCTSDCKVETGFTCIAQPSDCFSRCGDGTIASNEKCDDANGTNGDGCSDTCKIEIGFQCSGSPSTCSVKPYCGNGTKEGSEECDDGNIHDGDGCTSLCKKES